MSSIDEIVIHSDSDFDVDAVSVSSSPSSPISVCVSSNQGEVCTLDDGTPDAEESPPPSDPSLPFGECCICLHSQINTFLLPCYHGFCEGCLSRWFQQTASRPLCPLCKRRPSAKLCNFVTPTEFQVVDLNSGRTLCNPRRHGHTPRFLVYHRQMCIQECPTIHTIRFPRLDPKLCTSIEGFSISGGVDTASWWQSRMTNSILRRRVSGWIRRDLETLLPIPDVTALVHLVLAILETVPVFSTAALDRLCPFMAAESARLFLYELLMYLMSGCMDIPQYDREAPQCALPATVLSSALGASGSSSSSSLEKGTSVEDRNNLQGYKPHSALSPQGSPLVSTVSVVSAKRGSPKISSRSGRRVVMVRGVPKGAQPIVGSDEVRDAVQPGRGLRPRQGSSEGNEPPLKQRVRCCLLNHLVQH